MASQRPIAALLVALAFAGCSTRTDFVVAGPTPVPTVESTTAPTVEAGTPTPAPTVAPTPVLPDDVPGTPVTDGVPLAGTELAMVGVGLDGSVNVHDLPGDRQRILGILDPQATVLALGPVRALQVRWVLVDVADSESTSGWIPASSTLEVGPPVDLTAALVEESGGLQAASIRALGRQVARLRSARAAQPTITLVIEQSDGARESVTVDVLLGSSPVVGERLVVSGDVAADGRVVLAEVLSRPLCVLGTGNDCR